MDSGCANVDSGKIYVTGLTGTPPFTYLWSNGETEDFITGHTHVLACQPITGYAKTIWGVQTGTLAEPNSLQFADYTEDSPKDWRSGFVMLSWDKGRMLMPEMIQVCGEDEVEFRGEILKV